MKTALFYGIAALLLSTSVYAIPNQPVCADEDCSFAKLNTLRALASRGNKEINFSLGHIFMNPESGIQTDLENAFYYFSKSARLGFGPAYRQAAGMAAQGIGTQKDLTEAKRLMKEGADRGVDRTAEEYAVLVFTDPNSTKEERETAIAFLLLVAIMCKKLFPALSGIIGSAPFLTSSSKDSKSSFEAAM